MGISADLRANVLDYYKDRKPILSQHTKKGGAGWARLVEQRAQLEEFRPETAVLPGQRRLLN